MTDDRVEGAANPMHWRLLLGLLARLPQGALSRFTGRLADIHLPRFTRAPLFRTFARAVNLDLDEVPDDLAAYPSFDRFFTRRLAPGARSWPSDRDSVASPVDGVIGQCGRIENGRLLQAKGRDYSALELMGETGTSPFDGGAFVTIYLSPRHYHRIHAPVSLRVRAARHVPGALLPVNAPAIARIGDLFPRNERLICLAGSETAGRLAVVAVGAFNVGRITAAFDPSLVTNRARATMQERTYEPEPGLEQGDEMMTFHLGSTVVLLFERDRIRLDEATRPGREIRLGEVIAKAVG